MASPPPFRNPTTEPALGPPTIRDLKPWPHPFLAIGISFSLLGHLLLLGMAIQQKLPSLQLPPDSSGGSNEIIAELAHAGPLAQGLQSASLPTPLSEGQPPSHEEPGPSPRERKSRRNSALHTLRAHGPVKGTEPARGNGGESPSRSLTKPSNDNGMSQAIARYGARVRTQVDRALPSSISILRRGLRGRVVIRMDILPDGALHSVALREGSDHAELNQRALEAVRKAAPFPPFDRELPGVNKLSLNIPVEFGTR